MTVRFLPLSWDIDDTVSDGRIIVTTGTPKNQVEIKYQQLNPASHFRELVEASRCVILAGGTMSPVSNKVTSYLLPLLIRRNYRSPP